MIDIIVSIILLISIINKYTFCWRPAQVALSESSLEVLK